MNNQQFIHNCTCSKITSTRRGDPGTRLSASSISDQNRTIRSSTATSSIFEITHFVCKTEKRCNLEQRAMRFVNRSHWLSLNLIDYLKFLLAEEKMRFGKKRTIYLERAYQIARITSDFKMDVINHVKKIRLFRDHSLSISMCDRPRQPSQA